MHIAGKNPTRGLSQGVHSLFPREGRKDERRDGMNDTAQVDGLQWKTVFYVQTGWTSEVSTMNGLNHERHEEHESVGTTPSVGVGTA